MVLHQSDEKKGKVMGIMKDVEELRAAFITEGVHGKSDYFGLIKELLKHREECRGREEEFVAWQREIGLVYELLEDEIRTSQQEPVSPVKFGTSGWRAVISDEFESERASGVVPLPTSLICSTVGKIDPQSIRCLAFVIAD